MWEFVSFFLNVTNKKKQILPLLPHRFMLKNMHSIKKENIFCLLNVFNFEIKKKNNVATRIFAHDNDYHSTFYFYVWLTNKPSIICLHTQLTPGNFFFVHILSSNRPCHFVLRSFPIVFMQSFSIGARLIFKWFFFSKSYSSQWNKHILNAHFILPFFRFDCYAAKTIVSLPWNTK